MPCDPKREAKTEPPLEPWQIMLFAAADYMEHVGHCKGELEDDYGRVCLLDALTKVIIPGSYLHATRAIGRHIGCEDFVAWNDAEERTADEVVAVLRAAARWLVITGQENDENDHENKMGLERQNPIAAVHGVARVHQLRRPGCPRDRAVQ